MNIKILLGIAVLSAGLPCLARADITVQMHAVNATGSGELLGTIVISKAAHGVVLTPSLSHLPPGMHGFHLHESPSCKPEEQGGTNVAAGAAGAHLDPEHTKKHSSPTANDGHLGDLPVLTVDAAGNAHAPMMAPRISMEDVSQRALIIHAGGDNYADVPQPLGGGGARIACGVVE